LFRVVGCPVARSRCAEGGAARMLITFMTSDAAAGSRGCSGIGAALLPALRDSGTCPVGAAALQAGPSVTASSWTTPFRSAVNQPAIEQLREKYAHMTRAAAADGG